MAWDLSDILGLSIGPKKTAALAHWVQGLYSSGKDRPILVGGAAVELLTGGAYVTGDLDFVGSVPPAIGQELEQAGFTREGRHWFHEEGRVFLEFPSAVLGTGEEAGERDFDGVTVLIVSPEDLIVDRLSAWLHWGSAIDGVNAYLLYRAVHDELDIKRLKNRSNNEGVDTALVSVQALNVKYRGTVPDGEKMETWARKGP